MNQEAKTSQETPWARSARLLGEAELIVASAPKKSIIDQVANIISPGSRPPTEEDLSYTEQVEVARLMTERGVIFSDFIKGTDALVTAIGKEFDATTDACSLVVMKLYHDSQFEADARNVKDKDVRAVFKSIIEKPGIILKR